MFTNKYKIQQTIVPKFKADYLTDKKEVTIYAVTNSDKIYFKQARETQNSEIPSYLTNLYKSIEESKYILNLGDNWDDEGSIGYNNETWTASKNFLIQFGNWIFDELSLFIVPPKIYHGPSGSIDILWETKTYRILLNIEKDGIKGSFYADNYIEQPTQGEFNLQNLSFNLLPLPI